ncbi:hypothetical protein ACQ7NX_20605 [Enterobacter cloacae subsp. dissolvens]
MNDTYFNREEVDIIISRKPTKLRLKKRDYQELGRNIVYGSVDVIKAACTVAGLIASTIPNDDEELEDGFREGSQGYGHYVQDVRIDLDED